MNKIEEIIDKHKTHSTDLYLYYVITEDIISMMKEYAEYYAIKCLEIAAEEADVEYTDGPVDRDSILNIKLPKHE